MEQYARGLGSRLDPSYPRCWTSLGKTGPADIPYRFELLRRHAAGEGGLNEMFARYLGKTTPRPAPLPKRVMPDDENRHGDQRESAEPD